MAIAGLEGMRLVTPVGSTRGHIGRRAITYRLSPDARIGVGMDLGGTSLRSGLIDFAGEVRSEQSQLTPLTNFEDLVQEISNSIYTLKSKAKISKEIDLLVIGIPGVVNPQTGTVSMSPNVEYLNGLDLCAKLKDSFNCEVIIENDVNLAAIGEKESLKLDDFVFVSLGTGIGMALVLEGQLRRGSKGSAGEIGYMTFNFQEQNISKFTILENMVGGKALEAIYKKNTGKDCTMEDIFLFAQKGEKYAKYLMKNLINNLTRALRDVIAIVDPATIIMGGGMGSQEEICQELRMNLQNQINQKIDIRSTTLTSRAGVVGAMSVALNGIRNMAVNSSSHIDFGVTS